MTSLSSPPVSVPSRKSSTDGSTVQQINQGLPQGNITFVQSKEIIHLSLAENAEFRMITRKCFIKTCHISRPKKATSVTYFKPYV
jgi:hypothetical protein